MIKELKQNYFFFFFTIFFLRIAFSYNSLNLFIHYTLPGGGYLEKIHPTTFLMILFFLIKFSNGSISFINYKEKSFRITSILLFIYTMLLLMIVSILFKGISGAAYLVDTFFITGFYILLVLKMNSYQRKFITNSILYFLLANSTIAIIEFLTKTHLISQLGSGFQFRAHALLGHPLNNALITSNAIFFILATDWAPSKKYIFIAINFLSLLAFSGRAAMIIASSGLLLYIFYFFLSNYKKRMLNLNLFLLIWGTPIVIIIIYYLFSTTGIGERIFTGSLLDASGMVRINVFQIFQHIKINELLFGMSQKTYLYYASTVKIAIVENFWIELIFQFGGILAALLFSSLLYLIYSLQKAQNMPIKLACLVFLFTASTNNALTIKTSALLYFLVLLCSLIRQDEYA